MTLRLLYLIVIRVCGWLALLGCGPAVLWGDAPAVAF